MGNSSRQVLSRKKTSVTTKYAMGIAVMFILESVLIVALARIWLTWNQVGYVVVVYIALAILITYWLFLSPAYIPSYINEEALTLTYGHEFKLLIPMDTIDSIENTKLKLSMMFPFGVVKEPKLDVLFVVTGNENNLLISLKEPVPIKSKIKNYGFIDKIVVNFDDASSVIERFEKKPLPETAHSLNKVNVSKTVERHHPLISPRQIAGQDPILSLDGISKRYGEVLAVQDINLDLFAGELFGLLGTNGAGKTTTLKMISGLLKPTSGRIQIRDNNSTAYMPEFLVLYERMSGREFLEFLGVLYGRNQAELKFEIDDYLHRFELVSASERPIGSYSQGMKRKISLIGTLLKQSSILLLDEPTNGLDPNGIVLVKELLRGIASKGKTVIVSTHILEMAEKLCDRVGIISDGTLMFIGTMTELRNQTGMDTSSLEEIFIKLVANNSANH